MTAKGTFDITNWTPEPPFHDRDGVTLALVTLDKTWHGDLTGTSVVTMLVASTPVENSRSYVALEHFEGTVEGRSGAFVVQHDAVSDAGAQSLLARVVPDSATGSCAASGARSPSRWPPTAPTPTPSTTRSDAVGAARPFTVKPVAVTVRYVKRSDDDDPVDRGRPGTQRALALRAGRAAPSRVIVADDRMTAATAYRLACEGTALLWRGDFNNARQLLSAMGRRCKPAAAGSGFHRHRQAAPSAPARSGCCWSRTPRGTSCRCAGLPTYGRRAPRCTAPTPRPPSGRSRSCSA
ncbi:DUF3224 domain-containing protein [Nonomuraea antimicrobica]